MYWELGYYFALPMAFFAGWYLIIALTVHPVKLFSRAFLLALIVIATLALVVVSSFLWNISLVVTTSLCSFMLGYYLKAKIFLSQKDSRHLPILVRDSSTPGDHLAIVYFTHGEPETFNPIGWINQFRELDQQGIKFIPFIARPLFIHLLRKKYLKAGKSHHRQTHLNMLKSLQALFREERKTDIRFYISFLDDGPRPDAAVIEALNNGASKVIVSTVFLTISNHTAEGKEMIGRLECGKRCGVEIKFTNPLWDSKSLKQAFVDKTYQMMGDTPKEKVGIALIGHGQPVEWDRQWPTLTEQENLFRAGIIDLLCAEGFSRENIGNAWMEFKEPRTYELMHKLVSRDVDKILYFASAISADAIYTQSDIPALVRKYPFPPSIEVINMGAWNDHPLVIKAIKEKIDEQM